MDLHHVVEAAGVMAFGLIVYSYTGRWLRARPGLSPWWGHVVHGLAFGALVVVLMISRIQVAEGVFIDARSIPIALIGLVEGWPPALLAALPGVAYRLWLGGTGAPAGVLGLLGVAAAAGLVHAWARRGGGPRLRHALALGAGVFVVTLLSFLFLGSRGLAMFTPLALPFVVMIAMGIGCFRLFRDVAEAHAAEEARREAAELRAVTLLARAAGHEINNPLQIILGGLSILAHRVPPDPETTHWIDLATTGAHRIRDTVTRLNQVVRLKETEERGLLPPMLDVEKSSEPG